MKKIKILIADDHPLFRLGVKQELESCEDFDIIAETGNGSDALNLILKLNPDVAVLDYQMPDLTGLEITRRLHERKSSTRVVLLTMHNDRKIFLNALDEGVKGYVLKDDAVLDIVKAVQNVASGKNFISNSLTEILVEKVSNHSSVDSVLILINNLTASERKILSLVAELKTNHQIAEQLFLSKRTIENHKVTISQKLQLESSKDLLRFALQNKDKLQL